MGFSVECKTLIKNLVFLKGFSSRRLLHEFPRKFWNKNGLDVLLRKIRKTGRLALLTGSHVADGCAQCEHLEASMPFSTWATNSPNNLAYGKRNGTRSANSWLNNPQRSVAKASPDSSQPRLSFAAMQEVGEQVQRAQCSVTSSGSLVRKFLL